MALESVPFRVEPSRISVDSTSGVVTFETICCCRVVGGIHRPIEAESSIRRLVH